MSMRICLSIKKKPTFSVRAAKCWKGLVACKGCRGFGVEDAQKPPGHGSREPAAAEPACIGGLDSVFGARFQP